MYSNSAIIYGTIRLISTQPLSKSGFGRIVNIETTEREKNKNITLPVWETEIISKIQDAVGEYVRIKCGVKIDEYRGTNYIKHFITDIEVV